MLFTVRELYYKVSIKIQVLKIKMVSAKRELYYKVCIIIQVLKIKMVSAKRELCILQG